MRPSNIFFIYFMTVLPAPQWDLQIWELFWAPGCQSQWKLQNMKHFVVMPSLWYFFNHLTTSVLEIQKKYSLFSHQRIYQIVKSNGKYKSSRRCNIIIAAIKDQMCNTQQNQFYVIYVIGIRSALLIIIGQADQLFGYEMCTWVGWNDKQKKNDCKCFVFLVSNNWGIFFTSRKIYWGE